MRIEVWLLFSFAAVQANAQVIEFDQSPAFAENRSATNTPRRIGTSTDSLRVDTIYTEHVGTGEMEIVVQTYPFARYEFYPDGALYRRIDVRQEVTPEKELDQHLEKKLRSFVPAMVKDIPNGTYHEFFPNGNIRIKGTLDGYNPDGTLKKTGEWIEWDENEKVFRSETYP